MGAEPSARTASARLRETARLLVGDRRGILVTDESAGSMCALLAKAGAAPTPQNRRAFRELLVTTPDLYEGISGVILCDETFRQHATDGRSFPRLIHDLGMMPGITVDKGRHPLAGTAGETVTEGLDSLGQRLEEYGASGARFAKWRAVFEIGAGRPSEWALRTNAHAMSRFAAASQGAGLLPVVEPEVLMAGAHSQEACAAATLRVLLVVFHALSEAGVDPAAVVLRPNMVVSGAYAGRTRRPSDVARLSVETLRAAVPRDVAGVAFLAGGSVPAVASAHLAAMHELDTPWPLTFAFGGALTIAPLLAWLGEPGRVALGQVALAGVVERNVRALARRPRLQIA